MAITRDGRRFATFIVFVQIRFTPTQKIRIFPTKDRLSNTAVVMNPDSATASTVMLPWRTATGIKENTHPFPIDDAIIMTIIKSSTAFARSVE